MDFQPSNIRDSRFDEVLEASKRQSCLRSNAQSNAALPAPVIDVTPGMDGYRVWIGATVFKTFVTLTNAARCAAALEVLSSLGCLPTAQGEA